MEQQPSQQTDVTLRIAREDALRMMELLRSALLSPEQCMADDLRTAAGMMKRLSAAVDRLPKEIILALVRKYEPSGILQNMEPLNYVSLSADLNIAIMVADALQDGVLPSPDALTAPMPLHTPERADETDADTATPEAAKAPKAKEAPKSPEAQPAEESSLDLLRLAVKDATAFVPNARIAMLIKLFASKPLLPEVPEDKRADLITLLRAATEYHRASSVQVPDAAFAAWLQEQQGRLERTQGTASPATTSEAQPEPLSLDTLRNSVKEAMSVMDNERIAMLIKLFAPKPLLPEVPEDKRAALDALLHKAMDFHKASQGSVSAAQWNEWVAERKNELNK